MGRRMMKNKNDIACKNSSVEVQMNCNETELHVGQLSCSVVILDFYVFCQYLPTNFYSLRCVSFTGAGYFSLQKSNILGGIYNLVQRCLELQ